MRFFDENSINNAINICLKHPRYRVIIAINRSGRLYTISNELTDVLSNRYCVEKLRNTRTVSVAYFKNGSVIRIVKASDSAIGNRCHTLIVDPDIPYGIIGVLRHLESLSVWDNWRN